LSDFGIGSIVRCRNREWVIIPSSDDNLILLRPLTGSESETCGIYRQLHHLGIDRIESASFPLPRPEDTGDAVGSELLWNAGRLTLRDGAGPFRSLGRISVRPRPYQFVPLLMALRLDPIRLLISDDVGVGKTIEALLIARELLDRGEIQKLCVLCPPYLCDQWAKELREKFHVDPVIIRSGTISSLERNLPSGDQSIFGYYPYTVVSIDYAKREGHRNNYLQHCPEFVIVDECHGAAQPAGQSHSQQQRHELLQDLAKSPTRHMVLLTATPHSGVEESFLSILGLLNTGFAKLDLQSLSDNERITLARHFVQRRRADIVKWLGEETPFPQRIPIEETYRLTESYRELFDGIYDFSSELVKAGESLTGWRKRIRYWAALALLRCVMSSPAAASTALVKRGKGLRPDEDITEESYSPYIYEPTDGDTLDTPPSHIIEEGEVDLTESEQRRLRTFSRLAEAIKGTEQDSKLIRCTEITRRLLKEGIHPIVWCRYIATSDYVAEELGKRLRSEFAGVRVVSITGVVSEEERGARIEELTQGSHIHRVLVATDCLSEGVNLQEHFNSIIHYDLPWNPNRLEQREGRVDRFGQRAREIKAILLYGQDNPVDGAVLDVLLRKAKEIRNSLGISVPVPEDSETIMEAVLKNLFFRQPKGQHPQQMTLFDVPVVTSLHKKWEQAEAREKASRTRFAQHSIKPDEVDRELKETDSVLGDPDAVKRFVMNACQRFGVTVTPTKDGVFAISSIERFPEIVRSKTPEKTQWKVTFMSPPPEEATYLGRNHPFVTSLAQYILEESLIKGKDASATRGGVVRTHTVTRRTTLFLLRLRFTIEETDAKPLLAEEILPCGFRRLLDDTLEWLPDNEVLDLLANAKPDAQISPIERQEVIGEILGSWDMLQPDLHDLISQRSDKLKDAHHRIRSSTRIAKKGLTIKPFFPPDLLSVMVLLPISQGIVS
jgi:superfamily II DNA or RNA helicase